MAGKKIKLKRSWKHRFFVEILLSEAELEYLASNITSLGVDFKDEWLSQRGKVCYSGLEDSEGLGAEINDLLALGFAVRSFMDGEQLDPSDSYWHEMTPSVPKIESIEIRDVDYEWEEQDYDDWMDANECPKVDEDDWC